MYTFLLIVIVAAAMSWMAGIEIRRYNHKRKVEQRYEQYKKSRLK